MYFVRAFVLLALSLASTALYAGLSVGDSFPATNLPDQFDKPHRVSADDRLVIIAFDMDASEPLHEFLSAQEGEFLAQHKARYIADISAMPGFVSKLFALPKMRDYNYKLMLNRDEGFKAAFAGEEGKLTVYRLNAGRIEAIEFIEPNAAAGLFAK